MQSGQFKFVYISIIPLLDSPPPKIITVIAKPMRKYFIVSWVIFYEDVYVESLL